MTPAIDTTTSTTTNPTTSTASAPSSTTAPPDVPVSRRERARAATIEEIKQTALDQMREQHTTDIRFTDIAKSMGMTPPALYRYFDGQHELLTALITDAYDDLGEAVRRALEDIDPGALWQRWVAAGQAYREWARSEPERFALILGMPVPGYVAEEEGPTTEAAKRAMTQLSGLFVEARVRGVLGTPLITDVEESLAACAADCPPEMEHYLLPADVFQAMLNAWAGLHGFTSLEAYGHFDWITPEARDALFRAQLKLIAMTSGLPTS